MREGERRADGGGWGRVDEEMEKMKAGGSLSDSELSGGWFEGRANTATGESMVGGCLSRGEDYVRRSSDTSTRRYSSACTKYCYQGVLCLRVVKSSS